MRLFLHFNEIQLEQNQMAIRRHHLLPNMCLRLLFVAKMANLIDKLSESCKMSCNFQSGKRYASDFLVQNKKIKLKERN